MPGKLPPQPPPANSRLYNTQKYNGFILTIDGHLTYSPMTDVVSGAPVADDIGTWEVANQDYFYNTSRPPYVLDRTGSFIKIYDKILGDPLATAIIIDANPAANFIKFKVIRYEFGKSENNLNLIFTTMELRLEDNWKFCSTIPTWIPAGAESLDRWIPIVSKELEPSIGQKLPLKGGVTSVDGLSIPIVLDTTYQDNNRVQRLFVEDAVTFKYTNDTFGEIDADNVVEDPVNIGQILIDVLNRGNPVTSMPDSASVYTDYPFLNPTGEELALPEPWFIDTEAIIASTFAVSGSTYIYVVTRAIDSTPNTTHSQYTVIFNGMPFPIGQTCKLWEIDNYLDPLNQSWLVTYRGMVENTVFSEGLLTASLELSALTFTARVNTTLQGSTAVVERRELPERPYEDWVTFYNTFIISQQTIQDTYSWIKIGNVALPIERFANLNYLEATGDSTLQDQYFEEFGLDPSDIDRNLQRTFNTGLSDVGYKIAVRNAYDEVYSVFRCRANNIVPYDSNTYGVEVRNWFRPDDLVLDGNPNFLPANSPWGFYLLAPVKDSAEHANFIALREQLSVSSSRELAIAAYLSSETPTLIHLFQSFCKGYAVTDLPFYSRSFFYTGSDDSEVNQDTRSVNLNISVIDLILQVLTSTGSGGTDVDLVTNTYKMLPGINGVWDLIPREFALGIPIEDINLESFKKVTRQRSGMNSLLVTNIFMEAGKDNPQKFLEDQILKPFFLALATDSIGRIVLVDTADVELSIDRVAINSVDFVRKNGQRTRVNLTYEATDLADSFTYDWKEPFRRSFSDPFFTRSLTSSGVASTGTKREAPDGTQYTIKSKARIFQRIQASPIKYGLKYAPVSYLGSRLNYTENVGETALRYLNRFNRIVPRAKFELFWDYGQSPDIGDVITFNLDAIPNREGLIGDNNKLIVGKVIDIKVDRKAKTADYTAILTDSVLASISVFWNLTAELDTNTALNTWSVSNNLFCYADNELQSAGEIIWEFDYSQFIVGSTVIVWDQNWRFVTTAVILNVTVTTSPTRVCEIEFDDDTLFVAGHRITLETLANSTSLFRDSLAWFGEGQKYL